MVIDTLIIGLGNVGMGYDYYSRSKQIKSHSKAITSNHYFKLTGGADLDILKLNKFKKKFKVSTYLNYKKALNFLKPKLVVVATNIESHYEVLNSILKEKSVKYILCEKPITDSLNKTKKIIKKIHKSKKILFVNYIRECDKVIKNIFKKKSEIEGISNSLIQVKYYDSLYNNCSHFIIFFLKLFGHPIKIENIKLIRKNNKRINFSIDFNLIFKKNNVVSFNAINKKKDKIPYEIYFKLRKKKIKFSYGSKKIIIKNLNKKKIINTQMSLAQKNVLDFIRDYIEKKKHFPVKVNDALIVEKILDKIINKI